MGQYVVCRSGDKEYLVEYQGKKIELKIDSDVSPEERYKTIEVAMAHIVGKEDATKVPSRFKGLNKKNWKIVKTSDVKWYHNIISYFLPFLFHSPKEVNPKFTISRSYFGPFRSKELQLNSKEPSKEYDLTQFDPKKFKTFEDPYTELATLAYQRYERHVVAHDKQTPEMCEYRLVQEGNLLKLVHKRDAKPNEVEAAAKEYWTKIGRCYSGKKRDYIAHRYNLPNPPKELTPEYIYRFNVGLTNIEIQDFSQDASKSTPEVFDNLVKSLMPTEEALDRAYTGRKILKTITGAYTTAGLEEYKPWVDQQELTQLFPELMACPSWEAYQELLAHIVVKKHLARPHPTEQYRMGCLIPAPPIEKGKPTRWYKVTSCISNGYTTSYTLEPACQDPSLPAIKLYRNTSPSTYEQSSKHSVKNAFNQINSPGYLGFKMLQQHENDFFEARSIPAWVGYLEVAKKLEDPSEVFEMLSQANESLMNVETRPDYLEGFRNVIRENDAILTEFFHASLENKGASALLKGYASLHKQLIHRYIGVRIEPLNKGDVMEDANRLRDFLEKILKSELTERDKWLVQETLKDLNQLMDQKPSEAEDQLDNLRELKRQAKGDSSMIEEWMGALQTLALAKRERIQDKLDQGIAITGHSLGGANAQIAFVKYLINEGRMPMPGQACAIYDFDAPGINEGDNENFKKFGKQHKDLFKSLKVGFNIFRRQEASDYVSRAGWRHLGATFSSKEREEVSDWLGFNAAVLEKLPNSHEPRISSSPAIHSTQFLQGKRFREVPGYPENASADYREVTYDTKIQGIFDSHGVDPKLEVTKKQGDKIHQHLQDRVWKFPLLLKYYLKEELRSSANKVSLFLHDLIYRSVGEEKHKIPEECLDEKGCFKVTLKGSVETKAENREESPLKRLFEG